MRQSFAKKVMDYDNATVRFVLVLSITFYIITIIKFVFSYSGMDHMIFFVLAIT